MASLTPLKYGKVVGRFLANISDGPDIEDLPEFPPLQGTITFTAGAPKVLVATAEPDPATYVQLPQHYKVSLDEFGYLTWRGDRGVKLVAPTEDTTNPSGWTWKVTFDLNYEGTPVPIAPFAFNVPEFIPGPDPENPDEGSEGLVDLTLVSPVPASNGEAVVRGLSIVDVELVGNALEFILDNGDHLDPVTVPQIEEATNAAAAAAASENAAETAASQAETIVNSFDLVVGDVTTGDPGDPASITITGGPPVFTLDAVLPKGDPGDVGPSAPDATDTTKGIIQLAGDLGGTASAPTVPGLAGKVGTGRTINTTAPLTGGGDLSADRTLAVSDATTGAKGVVQLAGILAGTAASPAFSAAAFGTSSSTACVGNDPRLADTRTPTALTSPYDFSIVVCGKDTVRSAGTGDFPFGIKLQRAVSVESFVVRANTADASGNLVVELRKNGVAVSGTSTSVAAASQITGGSSSGGPWSFAAGDVLLPAITGVGTTPGKGLIVDIKAVA